MSDSDINIEHDAEILIDRKSPKKKNESPKRKATPKSRASKGKLEKQVTITARTRLEPRLSVPSDKNKRKRETEENIEKDKRLVISLNAKEVELYREQCNPSRIPENTKTTVETNDKSDIKSLKDVKNVLDEEEEFQNFPKRSKAQAKGIRFWTDTEVKDLAYALQRHGFSDVDKLAAEVKTKTANEIKIFLRKRTLESRKTVPLPEQSEKPRGRPRNSWITVTPEVLKIWPYIRKWRRLGMQQMTRCLRAKDYSAPVMTALCNKFCEEEPEPSDAQVINVKLIYKYMADCMSGAVPPQLPPKESALVLDLLREVQSMHITNDLEEERQFFKDYRKATKFKPFQVKDEFKKKFQTDADKADDPNTVMVPEEIFLQLSKHKKAVESFSPLVTPVWMIQKTQEYLASHLEE